MNRHPVLEQAERTEQAVRELAARWHRADVRKGQITATQDNYQAGMQEGWVQAITLLTGVSRKAVLDQLRTGLL